MQSISIENPHRLDYHFRMIAIEINHQIWDEGQVRDELCVGILAR